eukprot:403339473
METNSQIDSNNLDEKYEIIDMNEYQKQQNQEMLTMEIEALQSTLNDKELIINESLQRDESSKIQQELEINIVPQTLEKSIQIVVQNLNKNLETMLETETSKFPKIALKLKIPDSYPSDQPPFIEIKGFWGKFKKEISEALKNRWSNDQMILYDWYEYCKSDMLTELTADSNTITIDNIDYQEFNEEKFDSLKYELDINENQCEICYQSFIGRENFIMFQGCQHFYCKTCMLQYANDIISNGEIGKLICPAFSGCKTTLNELHLKEIGLDEDQIQKVTVFSINQAVEKMDDFGWCPIPECAAPAQVNRLQNFAQCTQCRFTFCLTCKEKYHFFKQCPAIKLKGKDIDQFSKDDKIDEFKAKHFNQIQEQMNMFYIKQCTKQCPKCKFTIQKVDGCNKMICGRCGAYFCWMCVKQIAGYEHFRESPECGDILGAEIPQDLNIEMNTQSLEKDLVKIALQDCIRCPKCQSLITKSGDINLIKCHDCDMEVCFQCGREAPEGKEHFEFSNCYYKDPTILETNTTKHKRLKHTYYL